MRAERSWLILVGTRGSLPWMVKHEEKVCRPSQWAVKIYFHTRVHTCANLTAIFFLKCPTMHKMNEDWLHKCIKNRLTFTFCHITTYCLAHNWNTECVTRIMRMLMILCSPRMNIVCIFFLCLEVIHSLVSHKKQPSRCYWTFCELSLNLPRPLTEGQWARWENNIL